MPVIDVVCPDGSIAQLCEEDGILFLSDKIKRIIPGGDLKAQNKAVRNLPIRDGDVFIATYPKAGTHWAWEIVSMLLKGKADYEVRDKENAMLEFRTTEEIESLPSPRILNSHYPVHLIPKEIITKKAKIIHIIRNPKDVAVSRFNQLASFKGPRSPFSASFSTYLRFCMGDPGPYDFYPYYKYVLEWEEFGEANRDQVLTLYFEDMKEDSVREITKMAAFLAVAADETLVKDIAEACAFDNLKKADKEVKVKKKGGMAVTYRKGEVGDWKNWFTVAESERFDQWISDHLTNTKLRIRYQL